MNNVIISKPSLDDFIKESLETSTKVYIGCIVVRTSRGFTTVETFVQCSALVQVVATLVPIVYKFRVSSFIAGFADNEEQIKLDAAKAEIVDKLEKAGFSVYEGLIEASSIKSN